MDETTFQHELIQLKNRVSEMASTYYRLPSSPQSQPVLQDKFAHQLEGVKSRLQSMQTSLGHLIAERSQKLTPQSLLNNDGAKLPAHVPVPPTINRLALPSGPLFWQLFTSLRTDVRGLDSRVATLELDLSGLEDQVDRLDPENHTPPASEDNDSSHQQSWAQSLQPSSDVSPQAADDCQPEDQRTSFHDRVFHETSNDASHSCNAAIPPPVYSAVFPTPQGVAFRDREIAQLEERIRQTQEDLRQSEDLISQKDAELEQMSRECQIKDSRIAELDRISHERGKAAVAYHKEFRHLLRTRDADLQSRTAQQQAMQQSFRQARNRIQDLEQSVRDFRSSEKHAREELIASKDSEISKLQGFCEAKNAVVSEQEQIISRGAQIIQERDDEIERLCRRLKIVDDDHRQEIRERERCSKLLDERDQEIKQLQQSLTQALLPKQSPLKRRSISSDTNAQPRDGESLIRCSPFATASASVPPKLLSTGQWTPQPIHKYERLPHEQARLSAWSPDTGAQYRFGVPGVATPPAQQRPLKAEEQKRDLRRSDSLKLLQRLALAEEGANKPAQGDRMGSSDGARRHRLPLDSIYRPPLPALLPPVPPRKTASSADLSARRNDDFGPEHQRPISKHQSHQDVSRRKLQPYVEEGEQNGEE